jgi:hypothetical protein
MDIKMEISTNADDQDYLQDIRDMCDMLRINDYRVALWDIQQRLRSILKYEVTEENALELLDKFYRFELPEILEGIDVD